MVQELSAEGRRIVEDVAARHGASTEAVTLLLGALVAGGGTQAQFNIAELGGMGQWSRGGMTMVGDMFNQALKARVDALCSDLAASIGSLQVFAPAAQAQGQGASLFVSGGASGNWWPEGLGRASSTGSQNDMRYAVFPETRRLAVEARGRVTVYDAGDHRIGGVSQQQSGDQSLSFTSQHGTVLAETLPVISRGGGVAPATGHSTEPNTEAVRLLATPADDVPPLSGDDGIFVTIERLARLHQKGILTEGEFEAKKQELLARL